MSSQSNLEKRSKQNMSFFKGVRSEFNKVTWPTKEELIRNTIVVLVFCIFIALFVWVVDLGLHKLLSLIIKKQYTKEVGTFSPHNMAESDKGKWYVVHTYSGHENKVKANLEKLVENRGMQDIIFNIEVPMEEYAENKDGKIVIKERKKFPGYVIVKMVMTDESWYLIRNTRGVTSFVGQGTKPIPLTDEEVAKLGVHEEIPQLDAEVGDTVIIKDGAFKDVEAVIKEIDNERGKVKASISIFGRETEVDLDFNQFDKFN